MLDKKQIAVFQKEILDWFSKNKRDLPWRKSRDPYSILISEVMLQQTQVQRAIPKFESWMKRFPTVKDLAKASVRDVLSMWSGLGYNRRALYLKKLAEEVVKNYNGIFSQEEKVLMQLPGVGTYTARAILCFAYDKQIAVVDTNVRKVILTYFGKYVQDTPKEIQVFADSLLPKGKAYAWNQALMDYASVNLKKEKIAIPKQTKFKDSDRYYRGKIMKLLVTKGNLNQQIINTLFPDVSPERMQKIIMSLEKDKLLQKKGKFIQLTR